MYADIMEALSLIASVQSLNVSIRLVVVDRLDRKPSIKIGKKQSRDIRSRSRYHGKRNVSEERIQGMLLTVVLAHVVPYISPVVFDKNNHVVVYAHSRTPVLVSAVMQV